MDVKKKVNDLMKKAVEHAVREDLEEWPPECLFYLYQPQRPEMPEESDK